MDKLESLSFNQNHQKADNVLTLQCNFPCIFNINTFLINDQIFTLHLCCTLSENTFKESSFFLKQLFIITVLFMKLSDKHKRNNSFELEPRKCFKAKPQMDHKKRKKTSQAVSVHLKRQMRK